MAEAKKRILVVEDEEAILNLIEITLELSGYEVATASNGRQAIELIEASLPDLVVLDMVMPVMDGFEVLARLKSLPPVPVISCSAARENAQTALALGANDFVAKPFDTNDLATRVARLLNQNGSQ